MTDECHRLIGLTLSITLAGLRQNSQCPETNRSGSPEAAFLK